MRNWRAAALVSALACVLASCGGAKKSAEMKPAPAEYKVRMQTTKGDVVVLVHRDWAPIGADHFYELTKMGFYDGNRFFRTVPGFIVQWGVNGDPKVNKDWSEITIHDDPPKVSNKIGTVVFAATSNPNSRSTQLFINLGDNSASLDPQGLYSLWRSDSGNGECDAHRHGIWGTAEPGGNRRYWQSISRRTFPQARLHKEGDDHTLSSRA